MFELTDERKELYQWDTGRTINVDGSCTQLHFSNVEYGVSVDVDVDTVSNVAKIPDALLTVHGLLYVYGFIGNSGNGYTKVAQVFNVKPRPKPADYVYTADELKTYEELEAKITALENAMNQADSALQTAINTVQSNLDNAVAELQDAVDANETDIEAKVSELDSAYKAADLLIRSDLTEADGELEAKIGEIDERIKYVQNELSGQIANTQTEVADIHIGYDGKTYKTAGEAVRSQTSGLNDALTEKIDELKQDLVDFNRVTEFGESHFIYDGYINKTYGFTPDSNFKTSEIVEIGNAKSILCKYTSMDNLVNYLILDINGERVSSHIGTESTLTHIEEVIDFPPTAYKIQISKLKTSNDKFYLFGEKENNNSKKWLVVGDSITEGATNGNISYADYIKSELGISLIKEGHSGWGFSRLVQNFASFDTNNSADIITIFAGTNDFNISKGAGTETDNWGPSCETIWALCNYFMPYIQNRYPTKPIIFFTPLQRQYHGEDTSSITTMTDANGVTLREYVQAFIDAGAKYGIPVIDLYSMSGIGVSNIDAMTNDGLHPNEIGQKRLAKLFKAEIKKYLLN